MAERHQKTGRKRQIASSDFLEVISEVDEPLLAPGASSKHDLTFKLLTTLEMELDFTVECPNSDVVGYPGENEGFNDAPWKGGQTFGGLHEDLRVAGFTKDVQVNPNFASTGKARNQKLALKARARCRSGEWDTGIDLDHPIVVTT